MSLSPSEHAAMDAMRNDGATVEALRELNPAMPQIIAPYGGQLHLVRVPVLDQGETVGLEQSQAEANWDAGWKGPVIKSDDAQAILDAIFSATAPTVPPVVLTPPSGLYGATALAYDTGTAAQNNPGIWSVDAPALRATFSSSQFDSVELWFRVNADATAPSGTTRNVGIVLRETNANNAIEILWQWGPTNSGVVVQRRVSGVVTAETATVSNVPTAPNNVRWHKLRVDLASGTLTVRCDNGNPIAWQGTLSGAALAVTGKPGVIATNVKSDFVLWTPPVPAAPGATRIKYYITPQANRPSQMIVTPQYPIGGGANPQPFSGNVTYERVVAANTANRIQLLSSQPGFTGAVMRFAPKPGDLYNNGNRAGFRLTGTNVARKKCFVATVGDRTRDTIKVRFSTAGSPSNINITKTGGTTGGVWGVFIQYHQVSSIGSSPPVYLGFRPHYVTGQYFMFLGLLGDYFDAAGQYNTNTMNADGTWTTGGSVFWVEQVTLDHTYTFILDVYHSNIGTGTPQIYVTPRPSVTPTMQAGAVSLTVDGVVKVNNQLIQTAYDSSNFADATLYQNRSIDKDRYLDVGDFFHEHNAGINNPLYGQLP